MVLLQNKLEEVGNVAIPKVIFKHVDPPNLISDQGPGLICLKLGRFTLCLLRNAVKKEADPNANGSEYEITSSTKL